MIAYIKGTLEEVGADFAVLDVGDIGYQVKVPGRIAEQLPSLHSTVKIYTYTYVREDILALYGFLEKADLEMFQLLLTVNGVGPKGALGILSMYSAEQLRLAILSQDSKTIAKAPGVGAKTAQRMLIDLKDKVSIEDSFVNKEAAVYAAGAEAASPAGAKTDAIEALTALGYSASEAYKGVNALEITEDMDSEAILKAALKRMF